jgi:hypothetical protein
MMWQLQRYRCGQHPHRCCLCRKPVWLPLACQHEAVAAGVVPAWHARWLLGAQLSAAPAPVAARWIARLVACPDAVKLVVVVCVMAAVTAGPMMALVQLVLERRPGSGRMLRAWARPLLGRLADALALRGLWQDLAAIDAVDTAGLAC